MSLPRIDPKLAVGGIVGAIAVAIGVKVLSGPAAPQGSVDGSQPYSRGDYGKRKRKHEKRDHHGKKHKKHKHDD